MSRVQFCKQPMTWDAMTSAVRISTNHSAPLHFPATALAGARLKGRMIWRESRAFNHNDLPGLKIYLRVLGWQITKKHSTLPWYESESLSQRLIIRGIILLDQRDFPFNCFVMCAGISKYMGLHKQFTTVRVYEQQWSKWKIYKYCLFFIYHSWNLR